MTVDKILMEVRALRGQVLRDFSGEEQRIALAILSRVIQILWCSRYDEMIAINERMRAILRGDEDEQP